MHAGFTCSAQSSLATAQFQIIRRRGVWRVMHRTAEAHPKSQAAQQMMTTQNTMCNFIAVKAM